MPENIANIIISRQICLSINVRLKEDILILTNEDHTIF
jgi:hypothetical protein